MTDHVVDLTTSAATARHARELFKAGYCCSQSVLLAIAKHQGVDTSLLTALATGFCGGIAQSRHMCGAVTGAIMGLGLVNGVQAPGESRDANYQAVRALLAGFEAQFGSTNCFDLTNCNFTTPEGQAKFQAEKINIRCEAFVEQATRLALEAVK